jgi:hypothetical protein
MRKVKCVSPYGGAVNGLRADTGEGAPPGYAGPLRLPPHPGGYVDVPALARAVAVGTEVDAPDPPAFICDGVNFVNASGAPDQCAGAPCWCGRHAPGAPPAPEPAPYAAPLTPPPAPPSPEED